MSFAIKEKEVFLGEVAFVIDTDTNNFIHDGDNKNSEIIGMFRWNLDRSKNVSSLVSIKNTDANKKIIEDLLNPDHLFNAMKEILHDDDTFSGLEINNKDKHSDIYENLGSLMTDRISHSKFKK